MSHLIEAVDQLIHPDHRMVGVADAVAIMDEGSTVPGGGFLGINPNEILIGTGQDGMNVQLRLEVWDGPPAPPQDHEISETTSLDLPTGEICIDLTLHGWIADVLRVPAGHYQTVVTAWDRTRVTDLYWEIGRRANFVRDNGEYAALLDGSQGYEQYLVQLWRLGGAISSDRTESDEPDAAPDTGSSPSPSQGGSPKRRRSWRLGDRPTLIGPLPPPSLEDMERRERGQ